MDKIILKWFIIGNFATWSNVIESCSSGLNDVGSGIIQQLYGTIREAECKLLSNTFYKQYDPKDGEEFDFIIVGAGSAGSVVASRLSEQRNWKVLLLEAGGDPTLSSEIPSLLTSSFQTHLDWDYRTEPEPNCCLSSLNQSCYLPRGKVMGGTSTINGMLYVRGNPKDYDAWAAAGNTGWSYKEVLQYFKKSEDMNADEVLSSPDYEKYHGRGGYLKINSFPPQAFTEYLSSMFAERRLETFKDVNRRDHTGFFHFQGTLSKAQRCSSAKAFIKPVEDRYNLMVSKFSLVTKLLIHKDSKTVYGVQFLNKQGQLINVIATKEVILSAGAINSPQILMLSGIGPKKHLRQFGIDLVQDLQVGQNLQDHFMMPIFYTSNITVNTPKFTDDMYLYLTNSSGSFGGVGLLSNAAFINVCSRNYPDTEILFSMFKLNDTFRFKSYFQTIQMNEDVTNSILDILATKSILQFQPILLRPKSRGKIVLKSKNPSDHAKIYPGYLSNQEDVYHYLKAIRFLISLEKTKTMKSIDAKLANVKIPFCKAAEFNTDDYWLCLLRHLGVTVYHPVGTCKMGPKTDQNAVVDPQLKVMNVKNLRVIDASIIPTHVSGHPHAAAVMIGEKGSNMITKDWM